MGRRSAARGARGGLATALLALGCTLFAASAAIAQPASGHAGTYHPIAAEQPQRSDMTAQDAVRAVPSVQRPCARPASAPHAPPTHAPATKRGNLQRQSLGVKSYPPHLPPGASLLPPPGPGSGNTGGLGIGSGVQAEQNPLVGSAGSEGALQNGNSELSGPVQAGPTAVHSSGGSAHASVSPPGSVIAPSLSPAPSAAGPAATAQPAASWPFTDTAVLVGVLLGFTLAIALIVLVAGYRGRSR
jgi:hypothetical protein